MVKPESITCMSHQSALYHNTFFFASTLYMFLSVVHLYTVMFFGELSAP